VRCSVDEDGRCLKADIVRGHPLFYKTVIYNARKWRFAKSDSKSPARTTEIDYRFEIRGVRNPETQPDVEVTFELPNGVLVVALIDDKAPCRVPPRE